MKSYGGNMRVFDFDNTIYDGESVFDFFLFCVKEKKSLVKYAPIVIYTTLMYELGFLSIDKLCELASRMSKVIIDNKDNAESLIEKFWKTHVKNLKLDYLEQLREDDVIITASPSILIDGIKDKLNTKNIICSEICIETGKLEFLCFRENKVKAFKERYPNAVVEEFYTDSYNDKPLMEISKKTYLVKK